MSFTRNAVNTSLVGQTGTGEFVGSNSPSLTTPSLGNASCTGLTVTGAGSLPTTDGTNGQVLTTTGTGTWSFQDVSAGTITGATNLGGGTPTYISTSGTDLQFGTYAAGTNINFSTVGDLTTISATGSGMTFNYSQAFWVSQNNGSDSDTGTSIDTPFLTLGYAISQAGITATVIYLVDFYSNTETITTSGAGQTIFIQALGTLFSGTINVSAMDSVYIYAAQVGGITNAGLISVHADQVIGLTSSGSGSYAYINTDLMSGLALSDSTVCYLSCNSSGTITNDSTATLNGTVGGTLPGLTGNQEISGRLTVDSVAFAPTTHGIVGTTAADNAATGYVGQYFSANVPVASQVNVPNNVLTNIATLTLPAGDFDVYGNGSLRCTAQGMTESELWINTVSATRPDASELTAYYSGTNYASFFFPTPMIRVNSNAPTTVYLSCNAQFTSGTVGACGTIQARRAR
jgi:hypothetical protein